MRTSRGTTARTGILALSLSLLLTASLAAAAAAQEYALGDIPLDPATYQKHLQDYPAALKAELPAAYDARGAGIVTAPKNQGACGSCWAFASAGAMESHILMAGQPELDLSEQQLNSCHTGMSGCCGGSSSAPNFWNGTGPILEACGPYGDGGQSCAAGETSVGCATMAACTQLPYRVVNWHTVAASNFKTSCYEKGPSYWRFDVYSDFHAYWNTGSPGDVYVNAAGTTHEGGHAVLLIGWDDAKGAYLLKNSWGAAGGPNNDGTFWMAYSGHANSLGFGMSNFDLLITCHDNDLDGYGNPEDATCPSPGLDCDDTDPDVNPGALEGPDGDPVCSDTIDNDCDGDADMDDPGCIPCTDVDGDGYGSPASENCAFSALDCNDADPDVNPGVAEGPEGAPVCSDTVDNDCDGDADLGDADCLPCADLDGDGYGDPASLSCTHAGRDCDDTNGDVNPGAEEICDGGIDNDCDGTADDVDADGDLYVAEACGGDDCDDADPGANPGTLEICNGLGVDEDCDGLADAEDPDCRPGYVSSANASATAYGGRSLAGSGTFNGLTLLFVPLAALLALRRVRRRG